jgi:hypothetical protein
MPLSMAPMTQVDSSHGSFGEGKQQRLNLVSKFFFLNAGINEANVQFGTIRQTRSALSNYNVTTRLELATPVLVGGNKGTCWNFSASPMYGL